MPKRSNFQAVIALLLPSIEFDVEQATRFVDRLFEEGSDAAALDRKQRKTMTLAIRQYTIFYYFKPAYFRMQVERLAVPESDPLHTAYPHILTLAADLDLANLEQVTKFVQIGRKAIEYLAPDFAWADRQSNMPAPAGALPAVDPRGLVWGLNYYNPFMVEEIGRERLLDVPAHQIDELDTGGIILLPDTNPFQADPATKARLEAYLHASNPERTQ